MKTNFSTRKAKTDKTAFIFLKNNMHANENILKNSSFQRKKFKYYLYD